MTPNSQKIPSNQTHSVAALTAALYLASADENEMVWYLSHDQKMGPSENMNTKLDVYFLIIGSLAQSESENLASWSEELAV